MGPRNFGGVVDDMLALLAEPKTGILQSDATPRTSAAQALDEENRTEVAVGEVAERGK